LNTDDDIEPALLDLYALLREYSVQSGASPDLELLQVRPSEQTLLIGLPGTLSKIEQGTFPPPPTTSLCRKGVVILIIYVQTAAISFHSFAKTAHCREHGLGRVGIGMKVMTARQSVQRRGSQQFQRPGMALRIKGPAVLGQN
jgi:hypothetical protein